MLGISYRTPLKSAVAFTAPAMNDVTTTNAIAAATVTPITNVTVSVKANMIQQLINPTSNFPTVEKLKVLSKEESKNQYTHLLTQVTNVAVYETEQTSTAATNIVNATATNAE